MQSQEKVKSYLGLARNGGYVILGSDKLKSYDKKLYLVLVDQTAGHNSKKIAEKISERNIPVRVIQNLEELSSIQNCKILGIKNKGFCEVILKNIGD